MKKTQIIILAAGNSTRMKSDVPKVLHEIKWKKMIEYVVDSAENIDTGLKPVIVVNSRNIDPIREVLGRRCEYVIQEEQLGTGHAVNVARDMVGDQADQAIVLYGDQPFLRGETIQELIDLHSSHDNPLSMLTFEVDEGHKMYEYVKDFGRIKRDESRAVLGIVEMKDASAQELLIAERNPGYYCADSAWLWDNLSRLKNDNAQGEYYLTDIVKLSVEQDNTVPTSQIENVEECFGINSQEQLAFAESFLEK